MLLEIDYSRLPGWVLILIALLTAIGGFYPKIKSTIEMHISGRKSRLKALEEKVESLEVQNLRLTKANTALTTSLVFILDQYEKDNPDNVNVIEHMRSMIRENLTYNEKLTSET